MTITRRQFEIAVDKGIEDWMDKIHKFLCNNSDKSVNEKELVSSLVPESKRRVEEKYFDYALLSLVAEH